MSRRISFEAYSSPSFIEEVHDFYADDNHEVADDSSNKHIYQPSRQERSEFGIVNRKSLIDEQDGRLSENDSPYSIVRSAVPPRDDQQILSLTFRSVFLGIVFSAALSFVNQLLWFKDVPMSMSGFMIQIFSYPCGYLMARFLPAKEFKTFGYMWSLNPGPFSIKEHALIYICCATAGNSAYALSIIVTENVWYGRSFGYLPALLITMSSLMLGYSYSGLVREILVYPAAMIWPSSLVSVTLFRTFHDKDTVIWRVSRTKFFWIVFACSFAWYILPGYLMPLLSFIPILCLLSPQNIYANQIGDAFNGLGILNFTLDWSVISSAFYGSPVATPWPMACNMFFGFVIVMWIAVPAGYYSNIWDSGNLPIYSSRIFQANGSSYSVLEVINKDGMFDAEKYAAYGPINLPFQFTLAYALSFMSIVTLVVYTLLHHGASIYSRIRAINYNQDDIHARLMRKYDEVPKWWYFATFALMFGMAVGVCEGYKMLPWYWLLVAFALSLLFLIPVGIVQAMSNQQPGLNLITEFLIGYGRPGDQISNVTFKVFGYISMTQALSLLADQKLGHYMKIPPRHIFIAQIIGTVICAFVQSGVVTWVLASFKDVCTPAGAPWTCSSATTFYSASIIWGLVGPGRMFGGDSKYSTLLYAFLVGFLLPVPVWYLQRRFPTSFLKDVHLPVVFSAVMMMPPAPITSVTSWFFFCAIFNGVIHKYCYRWWQKYAYAFSAAMDSSVAIGILFFYLFFYLTNTNMPSYWGTNTQRCPLAAKGGYKNYQDFVSK